MHFLVRDIIENSKNNYGDLIAVKWLARQRLSRNADHPYAPQRLSRNADRSNAQEIKERSYRELGENVELVRKALAAEGFLEKHIAMVGVTSIEWVECYLGVITAKMTAVPLDAGLPAEDLTELINRADAEGVFLGVKHASLADAVFENCPKVRKIWILTEEPRDSGNPDISTAYDLKKRGRTIAEDTACPEPDDIVTIIYTSGTTGKSKGVMLTQNNFAANIEAVGYKAKPGSVVALSVLPIHHAYCLVMDWFKGFQLGSTVCINDSLMHMVRNMGIFKPKIMLMVPMMLETLYKRLSAADPNTPKKDVAEKIFGGNLKAIFTGGARLETYYIEKFAEYGVIVLDGYGMSECSPVISSNTPDHYKFGSVGRPLPNVEIKFAENGEIIVRGTSVMKGYYKMEQETSEALEKDGWLHTGDKGYLDEDGYLFINGRVKNLIILSNGENISPEELEAKLSPGELIGEVIVTGGENGLTARIYPDQNAVGKKGLDEDATRAQLQAFLDDFNKKQPTYRRITGLVVRKNPFKKSSTGKIKRQEALVDEPTGS